MKIYKCSLLKKKGFKSTSNRKLIILNCFKPQDILEYQLCLILVTRSSLTILIIENCVYCGMTEMVNLPGVIKWQA